MLPHQQAVALALQLHIEGVLAGHGGVAVAVVAAGLLGVVPVDGVDAALPGLVADAGADHHRRALRQHGGVVLVDVALDTEAACLHHRHERQGVAVVVGAAVGVDGLHLAVHRGGDGGVLGAGLQLFDVLLLGGDVALGGQHADLGCPQVERVLPLGGVVIRLVHQLLDAIHLGLLILQRGVQLLQLQLRHLQIAPSLAEIVGKQHVALLHRVAHLHPDVGHGHGVVLLDLRLAQGTDDAGEPIRQTHGAKAADHGHGLDGGFALHLAAAGHAGHQHDQRQHKCRFFHDVVSFSSPTEPWGNFPTLIDGREGGMVPLSLSSHHTMTGGCHS